MEMNGLPRGPVRVLYTNWNEYANAWPATQTCSVLNGGLMMRHCRICSNSVHAKHSVALFSNDAVKDRIPERLSRIIDLPVTEADRLPNYLCRPCIRRFKAAESFRCLAQRSAYEKESSLTNPSSGSHTILPTSTTVSDDMTLPVCAAATEVQGEPPNAAQASRKRTKNTSSIDASPHTIQARPTAKRMSTLQRKRLSFSSENEGNFINKQYKHSN